MENLGLNYQTLAIIGGGVLLLLVVLIVLMRRRKKGGKKAKDTKVFEKIEGKKYQGNEPTEEEMDHAPKLVLEKFDDGSKSLSFRFKVSQGKIKLDEIDPYDNPWIEINNYNELVGQVRSKGDILHVYMNRKDRYRPSVHEKALISIVYREENGKQWVQQIKYSSQKGARMTALKTLN